MGKDALRERWSEINLINISMNIEMTLSGDAAENTEVIRKIHKQIPELDEKFTQTENNVYPIEVTAKVNEKLHRLFMKEIMEKKVVFAAPAQNAE